MKRIAALACTALLFAQAAHALTNEEKLADLQLAAKDYVDASLAFDTAARRNAHAEIERLKREAPGMSDLAFRLALGRIAAHADNAHDNFFVLPEGWSPTLRLPVRFIWFRDGLVVARAAPEAQDLLGARVVGFEGLAPEALLARLAPLQGGTDVYRRTRFTWLIQSTEALHALGIAQQPDRLRLALELPDGRRVERTLATRPAAEVPAPMPANRYWSPEPWPGEREAGWRAAAAAAPLYAQDGDRLFRMVDLPDLDALYVQFRDNLDRGGAERIDDFVQRVSERLRTRPPRHLVLDLRFDHGGDNTRNRDLMREIAQRVPGRIFALTGPHTFSAGIASLAAIRHDGGARVSVVGEEVGDRAYWWSEGRDLCLPNAKVCYRITDGYWDVEKGCEGLAACFGDQFDLRVPTLAPDVAAPMRAADWLAGRDPAMEAVRRALGK